MRFAAAGALVVWGLVAPAPAGAQDVSYTFTTLAGLAGAMGTTNGTGGTARFGYPYGVAVDNGGYVYVADTDARTIRRVAPSGAVTTFAGTTGVEGSADGPGNVALFGAPFGIAIDGSGTLYVADGVNHTIRKVTPGGIVSTLAGQPGEAGDADGSGSQARFSSPRGVAVDNTGTVYVSDSGNHTIRKITPGGSVTTLAGQAGESGSTDAVGTAARFNWPLGLAVDSAGVLYVADSNNYTVRRLTPTGVATTLAGTAGSGGWGIADGTGGEARFGEPAGLAADAAGLYVTDASNHSIRRVTWAGTVTTIGGMAEISGTSNGSGSAARFYAPVGVAASTDGVLYVADSNNRTIRLGVPRSTSPAPVVTFVTLAGQPAIPGTADGIGSAARFNGPYRPAVSSDGTLYVADAYNHAIRRVTPSGAVTTLAGQPPFPGSSDGDGSVARFTFPTGVAVDASGDVFVADMLNHTIRRVTPAGAVTTFAGLAGSFGSTDGGTQARFREPAGLAVDRRGTVYVADSRNNTIRNIYGGFVDTHSGSASAGGGSADGNDFSARFDYPLDVAAFEVGLVNPIVYVADSFNHTIRRISSGGYATTLAGQAGVAGSADGVGSDARFNNPGGVAVDGAGNVYVADTGNNTIRRITPSGVVTTVAGLAGVWGSADGPGDTARFNSPRGIAVAGTTIYVADTTNHTIRRSIDLLRNGSFSQGLTHWQTHATPTSTYLSATVNGGVLEFTRTAPPAGTSNQATIFQNTGTTLAVGTPLLARFEIGNSSTVRKRISVLLVDADFSDLAVCTFWLPPQSPLRPYGMRARTTRAWTNASIYFYAATAGAAGGAYQLANVVLDIDPGGPPETTECLDPTAPAADSSGTPGVNLMSNGGFASGMLAPWGSFGTITQQVVDGVLQFIRPTSVTPAGVVLQATAQAMVPGETLTSTFELGNSSTVRKRVTVLLHDNDFSDLSACTFWLSPGQPLSTYTMRTFTTEAWTNATVSVYPATVGSESWIQLDNVTLRRTPALPALGTECIEPGIVVAFAEEDSPAPLPTAPDDVRVSSDTDTTRRPVPAAAGTLSNWVVAGFVPLHGDGTGLGWMVVADETRHYAVELAEPLNLVSATSATLRARTWLTALQSQALVQVSLDGVAWETVQAVLPSGDWEPLEVDLEAYLGRYVYVRLLFDAVAPAGDAPPDSWRLDGILLDLSFGSEARGPQSMPLGPAVRMGALAAQPSRHGQRLANVGRQVPDILRQRVKLSPDGVDLRSGIPQELLSSLVVDQCQGLSCATRGPIEPDPGLLHTLEIRQRYVVEH